MMELVMVRDMYAGDIIRFSNGKRALIISIIPDATADTFFLRLMFHYRSEILESTHQGHWSYETMRVE